MTQAYFIVAHIAPTETTPKDVWKKVEAELEPGGRVVAGEDQIIVTVQIAAETPDEAREIGRRAVEEVLHRAGLQDAWRWAGLEPRGATGNEHVCEPPRRTPASLTRFRCYTCGRAWRVAEPDPGDFAPIDDIEVRRWARAQEEDEIV